MSRRREFIKQSLLLSGTAALSSVLSQSVLKAAVIDPEQGSTYLDAEHVVILMQENRSFDHAFGSLKGVRGFNDPRAMNLSNGNPVWFQQNAKGEIYAPFRLDIKNTKATWTGMLPHTRASQIDAFNFGEFNKWLDAKRSAHPEYADMPLTMGYYTREDIPFYYALADAFTICDQHFSSVMSGTYPNRSVLWTGKIREKNESKAYLQNYDYKYGEVKWPTFPETLEKNDVSWAIYQNDVFCGEGLTAEERSWLTNLGCNTMEYFANYHVKFSGRYVKTLRKKSEDLPVEITELRERIKNLPADDAGKASVEKELAKKEGLLKTVQAELLMYTPANFNKLPESEKNLFKKAFTINSADPDYLHLKELDIDENGVTNKVAVPKGDILHKFRKDVNAGKLPTVSWLVAPENFSDHPNAPWYGAWYVSEVMDILTKNPEVWKKTIFILTYDENDGYFDHIPPFTPPALNIPHQGKCSIGITTQQEFVNKDDEIKEGTKPAEARGGPIGLGFRVPMIIASPWSRGGKVCSQVFDHTSNLQFLEKFISHKIHKKITEPNISAWHRTVCGNLTSVFTSFDKKEHKLDFLKRDKYVEGIYSAKFKKNPAGYRLLNQQEIDQARKDSKLPTLTSRQEPGIKTACALPYELCADGKLSDDKLGFEIKMRAGNFAFSEMAAGAPFKIYSRNLQTINVKTSRDYAVAAGDELADLWLLNQFEHNLYHIELHGPNGFYREFKGGSHDPKLTVLFGDKNQPSLHIHNPGAMDYEATIVYNAYIKDGYKKKTLPVRANQSTGFDIHMADSYGWYDFTVLIKGHDFYSVRYAGHFENGMPSYTDPLMGGV